MRVEQLSAAEAPAIVAALSEAFYEYPVMRFVLGSRENYDHRLRVLVELFVAGRVLRHEPLFGIWNYDRELVGAAIVSIAGRQETPEALNRKRETTWAELGSDAKQRYEAYGTATQPFNIDAPHHHLNMIGVRPTMAGTGLGRLLLGAVHDFSAADPHSTGVSLSTENPRNVKFYEHFGYRVLGQARCADAFDTWGLFRPRAT